MERYESKPLAKSSRQCIQQSNDHEKNLWQNDLAKPSSQQSNHLGGTLKRMTASLCWPSHAIQQSNRLEDKLQK